MNTKIQKKRFSLLCASHCFSLPLHFTCLNELFQGIMKVQVLMSVWNSVSNPYFRQQLESIHSQEGVKVDLLVRDDGSTDQTQSFLDAEQAAGRLRWYTGSNIGPARSFMDLLAHAGGADLYAFSDHDDVWLSDKLRSAADAVGKEQEPALYFCQTKLVDAELNELPQIRLRPRLTYGEALVYQFVGGLTMVMNEALRQLVCSYEPRYLRMHDIWIYDIALSIGAKVVFDPIPHVLYRQHDTNSVGQSRSLGSQLRVRWKHLFQREHIRQRTAAELLHGFGKNMSAENRELTERLAHYRQGNKWNLLCDERLVPANPIINLTSKLAILFNQF